MRKLTKLTLDVLLVPKPRSQKEKGWEGGRERGYEEGIVRESQRVNEREVERVGVGEGEGVKWMERKRGSQSEEESSKALMLNTRSDN